MGWNIVYRVKQCVRLKILVYMAAGTVAVVLLSWIVWRGYCCIEEQRAIKTLKSQGAGIHEHNVGGHVDRAMAMWRGPASLRLDVSRPGVDLGLASRLPGLYALYFQNAGSPHEPQLSVSENDVRAISAMTQLQILSMDSVSTPRSLWAALPQLRNLTWLLVQNVEVLDEDVAEIARVETIAQLCLIDCGITDDGIAYLRGLPALRDLTIRQSHLSSKGLRYLSALPTLTTLDLTNCHLTDESLEVLGLCGSLFSLDISDNPITDKGLDALSRMRTLHSIKANRCQITDAGLEGLVTKTDGLALCVKGCAVTDAGVAKLREANPLIELETK